MKRYILSGILWLGFLTQLPAQHILSLTQADCRELALQRNEEIQKANNALQQAELDQKIAFSSYLPKFDGMVSGSYMFPDVEMTGMELQIHGMYLAGISVTQPLYAGGKSGQETNWPRLVGKVPPKAGERPAWKSLQKQTRPTGTTSPFNKRYACWKRIAHRWIRCTNR